MPVIKALTSTNIINAFSGTPDGTKFLRDDGTLAAAGGAGYEKLVASGDNDGTLTLYDDTATVGVTSFIIKPGAGQDTTIPFSVYALDGDPTRLDILWGVPNAYGGMAIHAHNGSGDYPLWLVGSSMTMYIGAASALQIGRTSVGLLWEIDVDSHFVPGVANTYNIGSAAKPIGHIYSANQTVYDSTASTGVTGFTVRAGADQDTTPLATFFANDGTTARWTFSSTGILTSTIDSSVNDFTLKAGRPGHTDAVRIGDAGYGAGGEVTLAAGSGNVGINLAGGGSVNLGSSHAIRWTSTPYIEGADNDLQMTRASASVLCLKDAATGASAILASRYVQPKTADYAVTAVESNSVFTNEGTTAKRNFTLPTAVANLVYTFVVQDTDGMTVTANTGDTIQDNVTVSASAGNIDSTDVGAVVTLLAINATQWVVTSMTGTWTIT